MGRGLVEEGVSEEMGVDEETDARGERGGGRVGGEGGEGWEGVEPGFDGLREKVGVPRTRSGHEENGEEVRLGEVQGGELGGDESGGRRRRSRRSGGRVVGEEGEEEKGEEGSDSSSRRFGRGGDGDVGGEGGEEGGEEVEGRSDHPDEDSAETPPQSRATLLDRSGEVCSEEGELEEWKCVGRGMRSAKEVESEEEGSEACDNGVSEIQTGCERRGVPAPTW